MPERGQGAAGPHSTDGLALLERSALAASRAAALACQLWVGRGNPEAADAAATDAMRAVLGEAPGRGTVVVGEGTKDDAPMLYVGERLGQGSREFDIAVDPLECTTLCAKGIPGSLATIAIAEPGAMAALGPSFYMDKLVAPGAARGAIDIERRPEDNLSTLATALGKTVADLRVVVLDKPRHEGLIERILAAGASVISPPDGDVAGALAALLSTGHADLLMGIGGTPEGLMTACAAQASGGWMQGRLAPQRDDEARAIAEAGLDRERIYEVDELVSARSFFAATGITGGSLLRAPWVSEGEAYTESIVIADGSVRLVVEGRGVGT